MSARSKLALSLVFALAAAPALAGGEQCQKDAAAAAKHASAQKCTMSAEACQKEMASMKSKGWIGLTLDKSEEGTLTVQSVAVGSPAEKAGFKANDVLTALNGISFDPANHEKLMAAKKGLAVGSEVTYSVTRDGQPLQLTAKMAAMPESVYKTAVAEHMAEHATIASSK